MSILSEVLKQVDLDIDLDDFLDVIHRFSPTLAILISGVVGIGGLILIAYFFWAYMGGG